MILCKAMQDRELKRQVQAPPFDEPIGAGTEEGRPAEVQVMPDGCLISVINLPMYAFLQTSEAVQCHVVKAITIAHLQRQPKVFMTLLAARKA